MTGPIEPSSTIIACSSGNETNTAISVIRLSGNFELNFFSKIFSKSLIGIKPKQLYRSDLIFNEIVIDDILFCFFIGPNSYTGENLLELYCHGNKLNIERIINLFITKFKFIRNSNPGEFTLRALKNKKLTLSQVEGLDLLLNAQHSYAFSHGLSLLNGDLSAQYKDLYNKYLDLRVKLELLMDFSEDIGESEGISLFNDSFQIFYNFIKSLSKRASNNSEQLLSPKVVLFGPVNSGKSTFYNQVLGLNRSIISEQEGTTRDYISERFNTGEILCQFIDTAGVRDAKNSIEIEGIKRSLQLANEAFFKILVINVNKYEKYYSELKEFNPDLVVLTHLDTILDEMSINFIENCDYLFLNLKEKSHKYEIKSYLKSDNFVAVESSIININGLVGSSGPIGPGNIGDSYGPIGPSNKIIKSGPIGPQIAINKNGPIGPLKNLNPPSKDQNFDLISTMVNNFHLDNIDKLLKSLVNFKFETLYKGEPILISRHKDQILKIESFTESIYEMINSDFDLGIITNMLENLEHSLEELIGIINSDEVLDRVFSGFCIGK